MTICARNRAELFGAITPCDVGATAHDPRVSNIVGAISPDRPHVKFVGATVPGRPHVKLSDIGKVIRTAILRNHRNNVIIDRYVVMPNHIHMIMIMSSETGDRGRSPLQTIIRNMKAYITKQIGFSPWQKSFHDHIIRNERDYLRIAEYIENNPVTWEHDCFHPNDK